MRSRLTSLKQVLLSLLGKCTRPINHSLARFYLNPQVITVPVESKRLAYVFDGFRIAFLSDLHAGPTTALSYLERVIERVNELQPDLITLGGDYVFQDWRFIEPLSVRLAKLKAPHGVYAVMGNHDHWCNVQILRDAFSRVGITELRNAGTRISIGEQSLWLCGVEDLWEGIPDLDRALTGRREEEFTLLLSHNPDFAELVNPLVIDLMLSGHTHGGQIQFFGVAPITNSRYGSKYLEGIRQHGGCRTYVSRGIGAVEVALRIGSEPEITLIELCATQPRNVN